jgi:hypothetical protein
MTDKIKVTITYEHATLQKETLLFANICLGISIVVFMVFLLIRHHDMNSFIPGTSSYLYHSMDSVARFKIGLLIHKIFVALAGIGYLSYFIQKFQK